MQETKTPPTEQLDGFTDEQLEAILEARKKQAQNAEKAKRRAYEKRRNDLVEMLVDEAAVLNIVIGEFKGKAFKTLGNFYNAMQEYGDVRDGNKGNFTIKNEKGDRIITFRHQIIKGFDERATLAEKKLKEFLETTVKVKSRDVYDLVTSLLERNSQGDYDIGLINRLYAIEDKFDHPAWKESIALFKQSYNETNTANYINFYTVDSNGNKQAINLQFASAKIVEPEDKEVKS